MPNATYVEPDGARLASPEALSDLELPGSHELWSQEGDVSTCYYQYLLPEWVRADFGLPPISKKWLPSRLRKQGEQIFPWRDSACE